MLLIGKMLVKNTFYCDIRWLNVIICWTIVSALCINADQDQPLRNVTSSPLRCSYVRIVFKGDRDVDIPREPISGKGLKICNATSQDKDSIAYNETCCTTRVENALAARARKNFDTNVRNSLDIHLGSVLRTSASKFDQYFHKLLTLSKTELHDMFVKTYGMIYEQNSYVFTDLFEELQKYYARGRVRLDKALGDFFSLLYQKMFIVLNNQYHFDRAYLTCVGNHMKDLRPFGDVPHKFTLQVKRSFVASRTFSQALQVAADVVHRMQAVQPHEDCVHALTRMSGCNVCQGKPNLKACPALCNNVMKGCLAYHSELNFEWNAFVDSFVQVAGRLLGPFNIQVVVEPMNIKISEAIMNFQENGPEVSQKIFSGCGQPRLGKRSNPATELHFETLTFGRNNKNRGVSSNANQSLLEQLIFDINMKVNQSKNFWSQLPAKMCTNQDFTATNESNCWNGHQRARYTQHVVTDAGIAALRSNPELKFHSKDSLQNHPVLYEQLLILSKMRDKLRNAYNGKEVNWFDDDDDDEDAEVEGSGSGSGALSTASPGRGSRPVVDPGPEDLETSEGSGGNYDEYNNPDPPPTHQPHQPPSPMTPKEKYPISTGSTTTTSSAPPRLRAPLDRLEVTKAVAAYLFPIVVVWFQGMFNEW